ncbi:MAG: hypothetical protein IJ740_02310 [Ruminococcus sp.]|nr:hypothetical protein [Ruminococcus sp.]
MKPPSPYHSYEQFAVMSKSQKRRIYLQNIRMIKILTTIPAIVCVFAAFIYGLIGWLGVAESLYTHSHVSVTVLGFLDFIAFAAATAAISVQGENRFFIPLAFLVYIIFDTLLHMKFSFILIAMLVYIVYASFKSARHEADINVLRLFDDFPFLCTSEDVSLNTYRNDDIIKELESVAEKSIRDSGPTQKQPREDYTERKW